MKTKTLLFILLTYCLLIAPDGGAQAQSATSDRQAIAMLKEFYAAYITAFAELPAPDAVKKLQTLPKKYCTAGLLHKINAQSQQGFVEADPFTQSQDVDLAWINSLAVRRDRRGANYYTVSLGDDSSQFKVAIQLTVLQQGTSFKIAAIRSFTYKKY